jgi:hypothetical protein
LQTDYVIRLFMKKPSLAVSALQAYFAGFEQSQRQSDRVALRRRQQQPITAKLPVPALLLHALQQQIVTCRRAPKQSNFPRLGVIRSRLFVPQTGQINLSYPAQTRLAVHAQIYENQNDYGSSEG